MIPTPRSTTLVALLLFACLAVGCARQSPLRGRVPVRATYVGHASLPEVRPGQPDRAFHFRAAPGHVLFVAFGFTHCPDICPTTLADLRKALRELGPDAARVEVAFATVDLHRDTPEVLAPYVQSFVPAGRALRARSQRELGPAQSAFGATSVIQRAPDGHLDVSHTTTSYVVDDRGHIVVEWRFGTPARDMAHDLRVLLARHEDEPA